VRPSPYLVAGPNIAIPSFSGRALDGSYLVEPLTGPPPATIEKPPDFGAAPWCLFPTILTRLWLLAVPHPPALGRHRRAGPVEDASGKTDPGSFAGTAEGPYI
jgi:hypothetical protein